MAEEDAQVVGANDSVQSGAFYDHSTGGRHEPDNLAGLSRREWPAWTETGGRLHVEDMAEFIGIRSKEKSRAVNRLTGLEEHSHRMGTLED